MKRMVVSLGFVMAAVAIGLLFEVARAGAQNEPPHAAAAKPKFSEFASAEDLANELNLIVADLEKAIASEDEYKSQIENRFVRDGNMIALVATALALHDQDSAVKAHAGGILDAAHELRDAKDYAATKKAVEQFKAALKDGRAAGGDLTWSKISPFDSLMNDEVSNVNTKLKNGLHRFEKRTKETAAHAATMALIAENAKLYVGDNKKPSEGAKWLAFSNQFRASAADLAARSHAGDKTGANAAMEKLNQSCHDCHTVFNPDAK
jgi:hypothetical protein